MQKKILLQFFLFSIVLIISFFFYKSYFDNKNIENKTNNIKIDKEILNEKRSNIMHNIKYVSKDRIGNKYIIVAESGELNDDQPKLILMKNVVATINFKDSTPINISAEHATYNKSNYNTNFYLNVLITYNEHIITSDNLDLIFEKNLATISNNITYKNLNNKLQADKIEIDLITKNSKIFMYDKSKKVKIVSID